jgi:integrase
MPIKLIPPSPKRRTPYYAARGTYLGRYVDRSLRTGDQALAKKLIKQIEQSIECGALAPGRALGFAEAASAYMKAGGERNYLGPLIAYFRHEPLAGIDQAAIDHAAAALYPKATPATLNRQVYTPISAVLKRAGEERKIKRPKGWRGRRLTHWLTQQQAFAIFRATSRIPAPPQTRIRFRAFLVLLCYTGMRLGDALGLHRSDVTLQYDRRRKAWTGTALLPVTKNGKPRLAYLPSVVVAELRGLPGGLDGEGRLFPFHAGGRLRDLLKATLEAAGVVLPRRVAFHVFCHTWATWMRQHGGLDTYDLLKTDRWADAESADRYAHVVVSDIAKRAEMLPVERKRRA